MSWTVTPSDDTRLGTYVELLEVGRVQSELKP